MRGSATLTRRSVRLTPPLRQEPADGRVAWIEDAYSFTPEDKPERLAKSIAEFATPELD